VFPVLTDDPNASPQLAALQFDAKPFWTTAGVGGVTRREFEAPRVKVSPRVSVGEEGGLWLDHPRPKARTFPEATFEENASPQLAELQFDV
jgi:hypothetical protein